MSKSDRQSHRSERAYLRQIDDQIARTADMVHYTDSVWVDVVKRRDVTTAKFLYSSLKQLADELDFLYAAKIRTRASLEGRV